MPPETGTERSRDNSELNRTLAGKQLSPWLMRLMGNRVLPLTSKSALRPTMPALSLSHWQKTDIRTNKGGPVRRQATDLSRLTSLRPAHLPIISLAFRPLWGRTSLFLHRVLDLTWFRRQQTPRSRLTQTTRVTRREQPPDETFLRADEYHPDIITRVPAGEKRPTTIDRVDHHVFTQMPGSVEEETGRTDDVYPMIIQELLSPVTTRTELSDNTRESYYPTSTLSKPIPITPAASKPEDSAGFVHPASPAKIPGTLQTSLRRMVGPQKGEHAEDSLTQPRRPACHDYAEPLPSQSVPEPQEKYQARPLHQEHQPAEPVYESREPDAKPPLNQRTAQRRPFISRATDIISRGITSIHNITALHYLFPSILRQHSPDLGISKAKPKPDKSVQQHTLPYSIVNPARELKSEEVNIQPQESPIQANATDATENLPYSPPTAGESPEPITSMSAAFAHSPIPHIGRISKIVKSFQAFKALPLSLPMLGRKLSLASQTPLARTRPAREIDLVRRTETSAILPAKRPIWRAKSEDTYEDSAIYDEDMATITLPDESSFSQGQSTDRTDVHPTHIDLPPVPGLQHQPSSGTGRIYPARTSPFPPLPLYLKSEAIEPSPDRTKDYSSLWRQLNEPPHPIYRELHRPVSEPPTTHVARETLGTNIYHSEGVLRSRFDGVPYYGGTIMPELVLAPMVSRSETEPSEQSQTLARFAETETEVSALDIDEIARKVYPILKRRLAIERERMRGLS